MTTPLTTPQTTPARGTFMRSALAVALVVLAGLIVWTGLTRSSAQPGIVYLTTLLPLAAAALLFVRRRVGTALAVIAALLAALYGFLLSVCILCAPPPLSPEAIGFYVLAVVIYALALLELRTLGLIWVGVAIPVAILASSGNQLFIAVALIAVAVMAVWLVLRRRRSREPVKSAPQGQSSGPEER